MTRCRAIWWLGCDGCNGTGCKAGGVGLLRLLQGAVSAAGVIASSGACARSGLVEVAEQKEDADNDDYVADYDGHLRVRAVSAAAAGGDTCWQQRSEGAR